MIKELAKSAPGIEGLSINASLIERLDLADSPKPQAPSPKCDSLIQDLWLVNESGEYYSGLELLLSAEPPFLKPRRWLIESLEAGADSQVGDLDVVLDEAVVAGLSEATVATVSFTLSAAGGESGQESGLVLARQGYALELLPNTQRGENAALAPQSLAEKRLEDWQNKLLDLSLRNRLLNFREGKKTFMLDVPDCATLEALLERLGQAADGRGKPLKLLPHPDPLPAKVALPQDLFKSAATAATTTEAAAEYLPAVKVETVAAAAAGSAASASLPQEALARGELFIKQPPDGLNARLLELSRDVRTLLQEGGANTLYLALGFLSWWPSKGANAQPCRAPLVLLPVHLERSSVSSGFTLSWHDDEPQFNRTLVQMLERDFGLKLHALADNLPYRQITGQATNGGAGDSTVLDVAELWARVRQATQGFPEWELIEEVALSMFSFSKYLMWDYLREIRAQLLDSKILGQLLDPLGSVRALDGVGAFPEPRELDQKFSPEKAFCPLPADSSQLAAVLAASEGKSFVLIGPPGTGKSQTITNLIAQSLAEGKRVLFVSEKMAALDVVYRRLQQVGLGDFCLELHSNKADKKAVIAQLAAAFRSNASANDEHRQQKAAELEVARNSLNLYVKRLHHRHGNGLSLFEAMGTVIDGDAVAVPVLRLAWARPDQHTEAELGRLRVTVRDLQSHAMALGGGALAQHPLAGLGQSEWTPDWREGLIAAAGALQAAAEAVMQSEQDLLSATGLPATEVRACSADLAALIGHHVALSSRYRAEVEALDLSGLQQAWAQAEQLSWPKSWWAKRRITRQLMDVAEAEGGRIDVANDLGHWCAIRELRRQLEAQSEKLAGLLSSLADAIADNARLAPLSARYAIDWQHLCACRAALVSVGQIDASTVDAWQVLPLNGLISACKALVAAASQLPQWCAWRQRRDVALEQDKELAPLIQAIEEGQVPPGQANQAFATNYARWWLRGAIVSEPEVRGFVRGVHEECIQRFQKLDEDLAALTKACLQARLVASRPTSDGGDYVGQSRLLQRQITAQHGHMPLRKLIKAIPDVLAKLAPCMLMSPLSVAQYLEAGAVRFDLVVFDEASQIPPWDALGALSHARQVVMVGDPKQLPPTDFFGRTTADDSAGDGLASMDSILDECIAAGMSQRKLRWHYRSRHESLIAFSNHTYYDGELVTFPSLETEDRAVSLRFVDNGLYQKGGVRSNPAEAQALVDEVLARLRDPEFRQSGLTLGVVTFSAPQQKLIESLFDKARQADPGLDAYFDINTQEPLFIKNLENVQGDERDLIYFSIGYGPDAAGQLSMHFGPLSQRGGERRLNVAITRARQELRVFASFRAGQIDLSRARAEGARDLKGFLDFAERGAIALAQANRGSVGGFESPFESAVAKALARRGWRVQTQIGVSSFRIDLGIVDSAEPGRYLAGVECDGATYHSSATARDRDKVREQVLRDLGWEILRVWSTDWWQNPQGSLDKLDADLAVLRDAAVARRQAVRATVAAQAVVAPAAVPAADQQAPQAATGLGPASAPVGRSSPELQGVAAPVEAAFSTGSALPSEQSVTEGAALYRVSRPESAVEAVAPSEFHSAAYDDTLAAMIACVIAQEGPLRDSDLADRIARAHGFKKTGDRISKRVWRLASARYRESREDAGRFYWPEHLGPGDTLAFRAPANQESIRKGDQICLAELCALARLVMSEGVAGADLCIAMARKLDWGKLTAKRRQRLELAIEAAAACGRDGVAMHVAA